MAGAWLSDDQPALLQHTAAFHAAVGITEVDENQVHVALFYDDAGTTRALHFCWHHRWSGRPDEPVPTGYWWAPLGLRKSRARSLAALCWLVADQATLDQVPFAFEYDASMTFDRATGHLVNSHGEGLTCASFIMTVLASIAAPLVYPPAWPHRLCDRWWQDRVVNQARATHASLLRGQLQNAPGGIVRYRPEEILAAATETRRPVLFEVALSKGRDALMRMGRENLTCWNGACVGPHR